MFVFVLHTHAFWIPWPVVLDVRLDGRRDGRHDGRREIRRDIATSNMGRIEAHTFGIRGGGCGWEVCSVQTEALEEQTKRNSSGPPSPRFQCWADRLSSVVLLNIEIGGKGGPEELRFFCSSRASV